MLKFFFDCQSEVALLFLYFLFLCYVNVVVNINVHNLEADPDVAPALATP